MNVRMESFTVPATPSDIATALRHIADAIEDHDLALLGLWNAGFGEPWEACIQFVYEVVPPSDTPIVEVK